VGLIPRVGEVEVGSILRSAGLAGSATNTEYNPKDRASRDESMTNIWCKK